MKIIRQLVSFVLGVAVGVCLYSLLKLRPLSPSLISKLSPLVGTNHPGKSLRAPWVQRSSPPQVCAPIRVHHEKHIHTMTYDVADGRSRVQPKPEAVRVAEAAVANTVAAVNVASAPPAPTIFKTIGYVEKAGGQLEAIILQENEIQVVHIGDLIAGRYRVTKVSPDAVAALDETLVPLPMAKPNDAGELTASVEQQPSTAPLAAAPAQQEVLAVEGKNDRGTILPGVKRVSPPAALAQVQPTPAIIAGREVRTAPPLAAEPGATSLGYVQKTDGMVESVVADGDTVRLVPEAPTATMAEASPRHSQEVALPAQVPTMSAATVPSMGARADSSVHLDGMSDHPPASELRQASYQVQTPAPGGAEGSAPAQSSMGSVSGGAGTTDGATGPAASIIAEKPDGSTVRPTKQSVEMKPLGFVVKADGELAAILSQNDEIFIVRQGDTFAGHYRAMGVSADVVEAVEEPPRQAMPLHIAAPLAFPDVLSASARQGPAPFSGADCRGCESDELGEVPANIPDDPPLEVFSPPPRSRKDGEARAGPANGPWQRSTSTLKKAATPPDAATFVFQTLGYVESQDGEMQAIVADGSQVYLVRQGETFADQYQATSVDPILVLAVRVPAGQDAGNLFSAQTESGRKPASKKVYGYVHFPSSGPANALALHRMGAPGSPVLPDLGVNLLNSSLTGFDFQTGSWKTW
jgi:hypothetical protein